MDAKQEESSQKVSSQNRLQHLVNEVKKLPSPSPVGDAVHQFSAREPDLGSTSFMHLSELYDHGKGYLVKDTCIIEVEVVIPGYAVCSELMPKPIPATQSWKRVSLPKNPRVGQLFEEGRHDQIGETYENIGGFSILKSQAPLYKLIWLKYGHIASSKVLSASYDAQVLIVADIMKSIIEMHQSHLNEFSTEIVNTWEEKIKMAESLDFYVEWLRKRLEDVKKELHGMKKLEIEFEKLKQSLSDAQARVTREDNEVKKLGVELLAGKDESVKARENKAALESTIRPVLANVEMCLGKGKNLLFDGLL